MRNFSFLVSAFLALVATVFASVTERRDDDRLDPHQRRDGCLTTREAKKLRDLWISFFEKIDDGGVMAGKSVTDDFKMYSESTNAVTPGRSLPVDAPQYDGKAAFVQGQVSQTSSPPFNVFDVIAWDHGCDTFTYRWRWHFQPTAIAGIDFVFVKKGTYLIEKAYSEWNNYVFLQDLGCKAVGGACMFAACDTCVGHLP